MPCLSAPLASLTQQLGKWVTLLTAVKFQKNRVGQAQASGALGNSTCCPLIGQSQSQAALPLPSARAQADGLSAWTSLSSRLGRDLDSPCPGNGKLMVSGTVQGTGQ